MFAAKLDPRLDAILACPTCHGPVRANARRVECERCGTRYGVQDKVPVFLGQPAEVMPQDHASNAIGPDFEKILREGRDLVLNIGAGATATRYRNCIEFEHKIFIHTDVVGDAHHLPFRDGSFDCVFGFNVFEHLSDPKAAAQEIFRVLKPGGVAMIHTAFLQSLHEEPLHFFNATEFGVREWFSSFEIDACAVSWNFGPGVMLAFLISNLMEAAREGGFSTLNQTLLGDSMLSEWAQYWREPTGPRPGGFDALQKLPQRLQARLAAGFELLARKPAGPQP